MTSPTTEGENWGSTEQRRFVRSMAELTPPGEVFPLRREFILWLLDRVESSPGARDEDDAPELTADDFKRPSAKWNAPEPRDELRAAAAELVTYLDRNDGLNYVGAGSILHRKLKDALSPTKEQKPIYPYQQPCTVTTGTATFPPNGSERQP